MYLNIEILVQVGVFLNIHKLYMLNRFPLKFPNACVPFTLCILGKVGVLEDQGVNDFTCLYFIEGGGKNTNYRQFGDFTCFLKFNR